ncbi:MAG: AMMECR1 domain-containing protein, partial [Candidatus Obscuribacterales bacterium]|nr:AMMECR1 domain-containing protein [Candidatus Obscuribacterales bacterium]
LKIQVTVVRGLEPVETVREIRPFQDGVMVRSGGRAGVILPGEASDAYYEVVMAKLKAGIQPKQACQIYKIRAEIYEQSSQ